MRNARLFLAISGLTIGVASANATDNHVPGDVAKRAAIHPVSDMTALYGRLQRVPRTYAFPPDFTSTLTANAPAFVIEMTSTPGCLPCADLWSKLQVLQRQYGLRVSILPRQEALVRSGRLGLPWVGHPVTWVRANGDAARVIPIAIGTDHGVNLARNIYLAMKMMTGVRPDVGVRAMARFTGIVGPTPATPSVSRKP